MPIVLGIDFETTGLDSKQDRIIEVGAVLWDASTHKPIEMFSQLVRPDGMTEFPPHVLEITGLDWHRCFFSGFSMSDVGSQLLKLSRCADYFVAHNVPFEKSFIPQIYDAVDAWESERAAALPWIDTKTDIAKHVGKRLIHAAAEEGMLNPFPHRALPDVLTMLTLLSKFDFAEVERYAQAPTITLAIKFDYDPTREKNNRVRALGYHWEADTKDWRKPVKSFSQDDEQTKAAEAGFICRVIPEAVPA
jgi:DNA polymerase-3 subunit epsilon